MRKVGVPAARERARVRAAADTAPDTALGDSSPSPEPASEWVVAARREHQAASKCQSIVRSFLVRKVGVPAARERALARAAADTILGNLSPSSAPNSEHWAVVLRRERRRRSPSPATTGQGCLINVSSPAKVQSLSSPAKVQRSSPKGSELTVHGVSSYSMQLKQRYGFLGP